MLDWLISAWNILYLTNFWNFSLSINCCNMIYYKLLEQYNTIANIW